MSYLIDKKEQRKKIIKITLGVFFLIILIYFRGSIGSSLSYLGNTFFRPILVVGNGIGDRLSNIKFYFNSKKSIFLENESLKNQILESFADRANYSSIVEENNNLKEILNRKNEEASMILSTILSKPNQSLYDTLIVDVGVNKGIEIGDMVFAFGNIPIGRVREVYPSSSKVILFSNSGEKTEAIITDNNIFMEMIGRGGGNFEMIIPRDLVVENGDQVIMPGNNSYVLALVESTISDPRDPFTKVLLTCPINIQELKFVQIMQ